VNERRFVLRHRGRLLSLTADELAAYLRNRLRPVTTW
jgi:hypothetical protein